MQGKTNPFAVANLIGLVFTLTLNYLANALPINGRTSGEVSDLFPNLFTPAGFTFAIWGVIYLLLIGFIIFQSRFLSRPSPDFLQKIGWDFVVVCLANGLWLVAFHHLKIAISCAIMILLLGRLLRIYQNLSLETAASAGERWFVQVPFSVYLGWISVATIANFTILLIDFGWSELPGGQQFWAAAMLTTATALAVTMLWKFRDFAYAAVIAWALFGIYAKRTADISTSDNVVEIVALAGIAVVALAAVLRFFTKKN